MSWETDYYDLAECPCGAGRITRACHSPDNGWSRPYNTIEINCATCSQSWDVQYSGDFLVEKLSQSASRSADAAASQAAQDVTDYLNSLLPRVSFPAFKTMGAEFEYLQQAGLYRGTVGQYRYARRSVSMMDLAEVRADSPIAPKLIQSVGNPAVHNGLVNAAKHAREEAARKAAAIKRVKVAS